MNISVLDGGRSVWAAADINFSFLVGPLICGSRLIDLMNTQSLVESFRNATKSFHES
jgi:hypothetical protein